MVGVATALLAGEGDGWGMILPPILPLAVGLIDGLGRTSLSGYREVSRETFILSVLLTLWGSFPPRSRLISPTPGGVRWWPRSPSC